MCIKWVYAMNVCVYSDYVYIACCTCLCTVWMYMYKMCICYTVNVYGTQVLTDFLFIYAVI